MLRFREHMHDRTIQNFADALWEASIVDSGYYVADQIPVTLRPKSSGSSAKIVQKIMELESSLDKNSLFFVLGNVPDTINHAIVVGDADVTCYLRTEISSGSVFFQISSTTGAIQNAFNKSKIQKKANVYRWKDGKEQEIEAHKLSAAESTELYEVTVAVGLGVSNTSKLEKWVKQGEFVIDEQNAILDGNAIDDFFGDMNDAISTLGLVTYTYRRELAVWYLNSIMGILQSSLGFRQKYSSVFPVTDILWDKIDTDYKFNWFRDVGGAVDKKMIGKKKENTADVVTFTGATWASIKGNPKNYTMTTDDNGVISLMEGDKEKCKILQLSLKLSKSGAQGGKSIVALTGLGYYDKEDRYEIEDFFFSGKEPKVQPVRTESQLANINDALLVEFIKFDTIKGYLKKGINFVQSVLSKLFSKVKKAVWSLVDKLTSPSFMNRSLDKLNRDLNKGLMTEALRKQQLDWDKSLSGNSKRWAEWKDRAISHLKRYSVALDKNTTELFIGESATGVSKLISNINNLKYSQTILLNVPVNVIAMDIFGRIAKDIVKSKNAFVDTIRIFNSLSFDISMGDSEMPIIKVYGVNWTKKISTEYEVVKRANLNTKGIEEIQSKNQPLGGFTAEPSIQGGGTYLATYMYIFYEYHAEGDSGKILYKKMQVRPDKGGIAAESYPQNYIWDNGFKEDK